MPSIWILNLPPRKLFNANFVYEKARFWRESPKAFILAPNRLLLSFLHHRITSFCREHSSLISGRNHILLPRLTKHPSGKPADFEGTRQPAKKPASLRSQKAMLFEEFAAHLPSSPAARFKTLYTADICRISVSFALSCQLKDIRLCQERVKSEKSSLNVHDSASSAL